MGLCVLYCIYHKVKSNCVGWSIDSPAWIKTKNARINPINKNDKKCLQDATTLALNHKETWNYSKTITKIKAFIHKSNWEEINYSS